MGETDLAVSRIDEAWQPFLDAVNQLGPAGLGQTTDSGWTAREMLSHVAFWDEAAIPVLTYMLSGLEIPKRDWFASGYRPADNGEWPPDHVHNEREAQWGREHTGEEVIARALHAHKALVELVGTLSDEEAAERGDYLRDQAAHYVEHVAELGRLIP